MSLRVWPLVLASIFMGLGSACGGDDGSSGASNETSNSTTATSNNTASNGTTSTSNGTTATSNGTTATSNGTTSTSNGTTATSNGTTATSNGTMPDGAGLLVEDSSARSCEVVLEDVGNKLSDVAFDASIEGKIMRRGARVAVAFFSKSDAPIAPGSVSFVVEGVDAAGITIMVERCFDVAGNVIDGAGVKLTDE